MTLHGLPKLSSLLKKLQPSRPGLYGSDQGRYFSQTRLLPIYPRGLSARLTPSLNGNGLAINLPQRYELPRGCFDPWGVFQISLKSVMAHYLV